MLIQQTLIQYLLQKKNLCEIFKVLTIWGNINLFIRPQHHHIGQLRRLMGEGWIETVYGVGYRLCNKAENQRKTSDRP